MRTKTCLGFSVAILAAATFVKVEVLSQMIPGSPNVWQFSLGLGVIGLLALFLGSFQKPRRQSKNTENLKTGTLDAEEHPLGFFLKLKYWGTIFIILALLACAVPAYKLLQPKVNATVRSAAPLQAKPEFPPMRLQGIVLRESQSSVMINGKIYFVGDAIGSVRVVAIDAQSVTLELAGQTNVLTLRK